MISKINIFFNLSKTLVKTLDQKEKNLFVVYLIGSIFNTFLELAAIAIILFLLFLISGQDLTNSSITDFFNLLPINKSIDNLALIMILVVVFKTTFQIIYSYNQEKLSYDIQYRINIVLYKKFFNSSYEDHLKENSSNLIRLLTQDATRIGNQLISPFISIVNEIFLLLFLMSFIIIYDPLLGFLFFVISIIILFAFTSSVNTTIKNLGKKINESNSKRIKIITETFRGFDFIKLMNKKSVFEKKFQNLTKEVSHNAFKFLFFAKLPKSIFEISIFLILFLTIIFFNQIERIDLLLSYLSVCAVSVYKVIPSLNKVSSSLQAIQYFSTPFNQIVNYLKQKEEVELEKKLYNFESLSYNNLSFNFSQDTIFFEKLNFQINKKDFIGIYGPSGSGKSTMIKLLSGLLKNYSGDIVLNKKIKIESTSLKQFFSYVPQDTFILDENIITNISLEYDNNKVDKKRVIDILAKVGLYKKFKNSLYENLGESGIKISGGQRQRVSIARAIYNNKKVLILDESTSNLDSQTEKKIIDLLSNLNKELTIILISHKNSSLKRCNKLFEIKNKKLKKIK